MKRQLLVNFTSKKEIELHEFLRKESFETGLPMAEILRRGLEMYKNQKEEEKVTKKMNWTEVMNKARELANSGTFTDNPEEADGTTYLVADMDLVVKAFAKDIEEGKLGTYSEPEKFLEAHGIEWE